MEKRYALLVSYDGGLFAGFQRQLDRPSVQAALEQALGTILRSTTTVQPCGRTDAGVHATGQVVHFECKKPVPEERRLRHALNALLPNGICIRHTALVPKTFHARFSCLAREYEYLIWNHPTRRCLAPQYFLWLREPLELEALRYEAKSLIGEHDFRSFCRPLSEGETAMRYIDCIRIQRRNDPITQEKSLVSIRIRGNAFLHNMIRIIVGSLIDRQAGRLSLSIEELLETKDRTKAGQTAPPYGLYFRAAYYQKQRDFPGWIKTMESYPWMRQRASERP